MEQDSNRQAQTSQPILHSTDSSTGIGPDGQPHHRTTNGTEEVDRAIRRLAREVGLSMPERGEGPTQPASTTEVIQSLSQAMSKLAMGRSSFL
jgi:hypothetical protein